MCFLRTVFPLRPMSMFLFLCYSLRGGRVQIIHPPEDGYLTSDNSGSATAMDYFEPDSQEYDSNSLL